MIIGMSAMFLKNFKIKSHRLISEVYDLSTSLGFANEKAAYVKALKNLENVYIERESSFNQRLLEEHCLFLNMKSR